MRNTVNEIDWNYIKLHCRTIGLFCTIDWHDHCDQTHFILRGGSHVKYIYFLYDVSVLHIIFLFCFGPRLRLQYLVFWISETIGQSNMVQDVEITEWQRLSPLIVFVDSINRWRRGTFGCGDRGTVQRTVPMAFSSPGASSQPPSDSC